MKGFALLPLVLVISSGCPPARDPELTTGRGDEIVGLEIAPAEAVLTGSDQAAAAQEFSALARTRDGSVRDVSAEAAWRVDDQRLGAFAGRRFEAAGGAAAVTQVRAAWSGREAAAKLTVRRERRRVVRPAPAEAPELFARAAEDSSLAPRILYPPRNAMMPPNLGVFEVHWEDQGGADLFEILISAPLVDVRLYVTGAPDAASWAALSAEEWSALSPSALGSTFSATVRGMQRSDPTSVGTAGKRSFRLASQAVIGGLYYWTPSDPPGIYRHDFSRPGEAPERFYTAREAPGGACVGCHALSADGKQLAFTYQNAGCSGDCGGVLRTGSRTPGWSPTTSLQWILPTFEPPDGQRMVTTSPEIGKGILTLRQTATGMPLGIVPTPGYSTFPSFSPVGNRLAYVVVPGAPGNEAHVDRGRIVLQDFDPATGTFGTIKDLVTPDGSTNAYYPTWSPDGKWILFNQSSATNYDEPTAQLYAVPADGSLPPILLSAADVASGLANSWPKFAPFVGQEADGRRLYWFTFSSKRKFGARLPAGRSQLWMAPFLPDDAAQGKDPSAPAFWLPFQDINTSNHSAEWTQTIVRID